MAIHAHSIPAPTVQPLLRAAGPCRVLTDAEVIALTADINASIDSVRCALQQTYPVLSAGRADAALDTMEAMFLPPSILPAISTALTRRKAIFGAHAAEVNHV